MNELDRLRDDLHAEPDVPFGPPDLTAVMSTGRRIRRRRQVTAVAATGLAVAAVTGLVFSLGSLSPTGVPPAAPASAAPSASGTPSARPTPEPSVTGPSTPGTRATPPSTVGPPPSVATQTVRTGVELTDGEFALVVEPSYIPDRPGIRFALTASVILANDVVEPVIAAGESDGFDVSPGFHSAYQTTSVGRNRIPMFGYYAGAATRITGRTGDGTTVEASMSPAKVDGDVIILYWFDPATAGTGPITGMVAYDENGVRLPTGSNVIGHG
ncbi:hypothetical protein ACIA8K_33550 [Catenuloplanes sp. NPDC051500]|uniref:hypothetical protein n=1 Tax=Catenuloplanes sp. NPDC051500 TaxID=3363959 RepID=UPI003796FCD5